MSYTPINWHTGDVITAEKLNRCDNGWAVESTQLFSETVTTSGSGGEYSAILAYVTTEEPPVSLTVNFDGADYICHRQNRDMYGSAREDFSDGIPFTIIFQEQSTLIYTEEPGTHTVSAGTQSISVSDSFRDAVDACVGALPLRCVSGETTYDQMSSASTNGGLLYFKPYGNGTETCVITAFSSFADISFIPTMQGVRAYFSDGVFTVTTSV